MKNKWIRNYGYYDRADLTIWQYCGFLLYGCKDYVKENGRDFLRSLGRAIESLGSLLVEITVTIATGILILFSPIILPTIALIDRASIRRELNKED